MSTNEDSPPKEPLKTLNVLISKDLKIQLISVKVEQDLLSYAQVLRGLCRMYDDLYQTKDLSKYFKPVAPAKSNSGP